MRCWISILIILFMFFVSVRAESQFVQVEKARLLAKPSAFGKLITTLEFRAPVTVIVQEGSFVKIRTSSGMVGYLSKASLNVKKPVYASSLSRKYVSSEEVAMATKGFNAQVESRYRVNNAGLPFDKLDKLEKTTTYSDLVKTFKAFREQGKLGEFGPGGLAE